MPSDGNGCIGWVSTYAASCCCGPILTHALLTSAASVGDKVSHTVGSDVPVCGDADVRSMMPVVVIV